MEPIVLTPEKNQQLAQILTGFNISYILINRALSLEGEKTKVDYDEKSLPENWSLVKELFKETKENTLQAKACVRKMIDLSENREDIDDVLSFMICMGEHDPYYEYEILLGIRKTAELIESGAYYMEE